MQIAHFTNNYRPFVGGVPIAIDTLTRGLRELGHKVMIFAPDYGTDSGQIDEADVVRSPAFSNFNDTQFALPIPTSPDLYKAFCDLVPDVVHVHHPFLLGSTGVHWAREQGVPVVFTYHTQYEQYAHYLPWDPEMVRELAATLGTRFANYCDAVIAPSNSIRETLVERGVETPIEVIPTGVDVEAFRNADPRRLRAQLALNETTSILLFVSRLAREKNIEFLLKAFSRSAFTDAHFVLVGDGDAADDLRGRARDLNLGDRVHFLGTLTGAPLHETFRGADVFVFSSQSETQGMVILEAMASGLPVVALDAPGVRDVVIDGKNGMLVGVADPTVFAGAIDRMLSEDEFRGKCREGARETASRHSIAATARRVDALYEKARRSPIQDRHSRFLLLRELSRYHFGRFKEGLKALDF